MRKHPIQKALLKSLTAAFIVFFVLFSCSVFKPKDEKGNLVVLLQQAKTKDIFEKPLETLKSVYCAIQKGGSVYKGFMLTQNGSYYEGTFSDLDPGIDYSILLKGYNSDDEILGRGYKSGITIIAGRTTTETVTWGRFQAVLLSPENGSTITDQTPLFDWMDVEGASVYNIQVSKSSGFEFGSYELQTDLTISTFTPNNSLTNGTYYWRVNCREVSGGLSTWSEMRSFTISPETGSVTDIDGNTYRTVKIGNQWWMAENFKVTRYQNGDAIPSVTDGGTWLNLTTGAYCNYDNNVNIVTAYGRLYNW
jgi:hypothetical protein